MSKVSCSLRALSVRLRVGESHLLNLGSGLGSSQDSCKPGFKELCQYKNTCR